MKLGFSLWPLVLAALSLVASAADDDVADMKRLLDPATQKAEVERLKGIKPGESRPYHTVLKNYRLHWCPQRNGTPPLLLLVAATDVESEGSTSYSFDAYPVEKPEELFGLAPPPSSPEPTPADLSPIRESGLRLMDAKGRQPKHWDAANYLENGYVFDFDGDGILDMGKSSRETVGDKEVNVFELVTIEPEPKTLLRVAYNWRSSHGPEDDRDWVVTCENTDHNGVPEICFGPLSATTPEGRRQFVIAWDPTAKAFTFVTSPDGGPDARHVRILKDGTSLDSLASDGGLGYPVLVDPAKLEHVPVPQKPYGFQSLKHAGDGEMRSFFHGKDAHDTMSGSGVATSLPDEFWTLPPKEAALGFARKNLLPERQSRWQLAVDDRGGITPPASGWLTCDWGSSSCYSFSSASFALRFGVAEPWLLVTEYNRHGVVGADPMVDRPGYQVRVIPLSAADARFLADTIFWLERIRSLDRRGTRGHGISIHFSSSDGHAALRLQEDGKPEREQASGTAWTRQIPDEWEGPYSPDVFVNLGTWLWHTAIPAKFHDEWDHHPAPDRRNLTTPLEERLAERQNAEGKRWLEASVSEAFQRHQHDPIPTRDLALLTRIAGDERLLSQKDYLSKLSADLPKESADERELKKLESEQAVDHFGTAINEEAANDKKARERRMKLNAKLENDPAYLLRDPLQMAVRQLEVANDPAALAKLSTEKSQLGYWALKALQDDHPAVYADSLLKDFQKGDARERRSIFDIIATLDIGKARKLGDSLTREQQRDVAVELASFRLAHDREKLPASIPLLMGLVADKKGNLNRRNEAIQLLPELPLDTDTQAKLDGLLMDELQNPQKGEYGSTSLPSVVDALSKLPTARQHLERMESLSIDEFGGFDATLQAVARASAGLPDQKDHLQRLIEPRFEKHTGNMTDLFHAVLAFDLRRLAPKVAGFATESAEVPDGDAAHYSGGSFKSPMGHHYHAAREATAFWSESDPKTLARMAVAFVLENGVAANEGTSEIDRSTLATGMKSLILSTPTAERGPMIESLIAAAPCPYREQAIAWLRQLAKE